jgi:hypothetical protein
MWYSWLLSVLGSIQKNFFSDTVVCAQGLILAQQVLYHLSPSTSPLGLDILKIWSYHLFAAAGLELQFF